MNGTDTLSRLGNMWWAFALLAMNFLSFSLMGADKARARSKRRRISERALLLASACFASAGGILGMLVFRHKTKHLKFIVGLPAMLALHAVIIFLLAVQ